VPSVIPVASAAEPALAVVAPSLNIPMDSVDIMSQMKEASVEEAEEVIVLDEETEEMVNKNKKVIDPEEENNLSSENNEELKLDGFDPEATVVAKLEPLKPLNLNVNVDELFEMNDEPAQTLEPKSVAQPVAVLDPSGSVNIIVPPKSAPRKVVKASEEFKVVIRKPRGSN
jgi:hypothetical protein